MKRLQKFVSQTSPNLSPRNLLFLAFLCLYVVTDDNFITRLPLPKLSFPYFPKSECFSKKLLTLVFACSISFLIDLVVLILPSAFSNLF